ncbi:hypothetical protein K435DRAFT_793238, partial [Dendrothele bispora CBS 962.96]
TEPQKLTETKTAEEEVAESGEADDSWLDEEMEYGYSGPSDSLLHAAKFINPDSSELASILADKEIEGTSNSDQSRVVPSFLASSSESSNNDFSRSRVSSFLAQID